ncbi:MAG: DUF1080 domain-containing protein [Acidobacteria bacterium]|nr:DUF1080 domain-containing protein [Acidobacteriota bacterium]
MKWLLWLLLPGLLPGAENPFLGSWDITPAVSGRPRGWWLKVEDAGGSRLRGWFSSAYDGKVNPIDELSVEGGELAFAIFPKRPDGTITRRLEYRARLTGGELRGSFRVRGQKSAPIQWTGRRAPVLKDRDDGSWRKQRPVRLFNGRDLTGWRNVDSTRHCCWSAKDGVLATAGKGSDLVSEAAFWNFELRMQFRLAPESNSGLGLRGRYEVQLKDDAGNPPLINGTGGIYSRIVPEVNAGKGGGKWQHLWVRLVGRQVTVVLNGKTVIRKKDIEGLTAIAINADEARPGPIVFQGDHGPAEFRDITVTALQRAER